MKDDNIINLRKGKEVEADPEFKINHFESEAAENFAPAPVSEADFTNLKPNEKVKVKFDKFVNLIAGRDFEDSWERYAGEDVIINADLLAELASVPEEKNDKKIPLFFIFGIALGVAIAWFLLKG
ncbi:MAG: hypothetical protein WC873_03415 [Candidatus Gracilibacteria bacterium]